MKALKLIISTISLTFLVACAQTNPMIINKSEMNKKDHAALVKYYENSAIEAEQKLTKHKQALKTYEAKPYLYGRHGQEFRSHATANIREYEKEVKESTELAHFHRKLATEQIAKEDSVIEKKVENHLESVNKSAM
ncbi:hypothetical protein W03_01460 [Nitrosomonas sp. PY1]|uniref:hypothetical protein n=1 Tax=Nitrosomonas sp. PY1 TaxID=1803906 RepID=UPI001FC8723B|nr:hypothetical protein [Nitrosomonas sp. PY1]GKS68142.1 hypothetical protein W03_01460 [Nitrosomonas sp. PY1]